MRSSANAWRRHQGRLIASLAAALVACLGLATSAGAFSLGFQDFDFFLPGSAALARSAVTATSASWMRVDAPWHSIAPGGSQRPAGFLAADPGDRHYNWDFVDQEVRTAAALHLQVVITLHAAPRWAEGPGRPSNPNIGDGAWDPSVSEFQLFVTAAARRYSGSFPDPRHPGTALPRIRYWQIWNEMNLPYDLVARNLAAKYRALLNAAYAALKRASRSNLVMTGGLAPVSFLGVLSMSPLRFAAQLLCLRRVGTRFSPDRSCHAVAHFDLLADHPYTLAATPTKHAYRYDDILVADVGKLATLLDAAVRFHRLPRRPRPSLWVTEFSWFTKPPNTIVGDAPATAARYVSYALYEMWRAGVQVVVWFWVQDVPNADPRTTIAGGGLYTASGQPKPVRQAFAFPLVADVRGRRGTIWGRVPDHSHQVTISFLSRHAWRIVASLRTGSDGVFHARLRLRQGGLYRARSASGTLSLTYRAKPIPPLRTHLFYSG